MNIASVLEAESNAKEFLKRVRDLKEKQKVEEWCIRGGKETAALKRQSMDLTRSLAKIRNPAL